MDKGEETSPSLSLRNGLSRNSQLKLEETPLDAQPREVFIAACLLLPIIGIGLYPQLATNTYDVKTMAVASKTRAALPVFAQQSESNLDSFQEQSNANLLSLAQPLTAPSIDGDS